MARRTWSVSGGGREGVRQYTRRSGVVSEIALLTSCGTYRSVVGLGNQPVVVDAGNLEDAGLLRVQAVGLRMEGKSSRGREKGSGAHHGGEYETLWYTRRRGRRQEQRGL
jgi:hypothetical protein